MKTWDKIRYSVTKGGKGRVLDHDNGQTGCMTVMVLEYHTKTLRVQTIASWGDGWEHVSVSLCDIGVCPPWEIMCQIKDVFFEPEEVCFQLHPAQSSYVNNHEGCLHIWKPIGKEIPCPPVWMVGVPGVDMDDDEYIKKAHELMENDDGNIKQEPQQEP